MMKYLMYFSESIAINELLVTYNDDVNNKNFILYQGNLWFYDEGDEQDDDIIAEISKKLDIDDIDSLYETNISIIQGYISNDVAYIESQPDFRHTEHSKDMQKLAKELYKINPDIIIKYVGTEYSSDEEYEYEYDITDKKLKDRDFYHGTSLEFLSGILSTGIKPMEDISNYTIKNYDKIFITLNINKAHYHSINTYLKQPSGNDNFPIVLDFKVPDVSKLVTDYDLAINVYGSTHPKLDELGYDNSNLRPSTPIKGYDVDNPRDIENKIGVFGYKGRIPASYIEGVYIDLDGFRSHVFASIMGEDMMVDVTPFRDWTYVPIDEIKNVLGDIEEEVHNELDHYESMSNNGTERERLKETIEYIWEYINKQTKNIEEDLSDKINIIDKQGSDLKYHMGIETEYNFFYLTNDDIIIGSNSLKGELYKSTSVQFYETLNFFIEEMENSPIVRFNIALHVNGEVASKYAKEWDKFNRSLKENNLKTDNEFTVNSETIHRNTNKVEIVYYNDIDGEVIADKVIEIWED